MPTVCLTHLSISINQLNPHTDAEEMYRLWRGDRQSVHPSWDVYFSGMDKGMKSEDAFRPPPNLVSMPSPADGAPTMSIPSGGGELEDHMKVSLEALEYDV